MISDNTLFRLEHAVTDKALAQEISARLGTGAPADASEAQEALDLLSEAKNASLLERMVTALAGDGRGAAGRELAGKLNGMIDVLKAQADGDEVPAEAATATLATSAPITLTSAATGSARNGDTLTLQVLAADANTDDEIVVDVTGTADDITITVTPNDGTNNGLVPVDLTTEELVELINTGDVAAKNINLTDAGSLLDDQTAEGGDATALADGGEGDGEVATFADGTDDSDANIAATQAAMGSDHMSDAAFNSLRHALTDKAAAEDFRDAFNDMVDEIQSI